jgi:hypothetical protein
MPTQADTPHSLVRRYEVCIIPFAAAKARKLREIKAVGTFDAVCYDSLRNSSYSLSSPAPLQTSATW